MAEHGLKNCAQVYSIPDGAKYIVITNTGDYRSAELLQQLKESAVQVVLDHDGGANVFVWWQAFTPPVGE